MNNTAKKVISILLCTSLITGTIGYGAYCAFDKENNKTDVICVKENAKTAPDVQASKDETVYVLAGADGSVQKVIVSDWLKNTAGVSDISDSSVLSGIENVKGDEDFTVGSGNSLVWESGGNDIYYQGSTDKELPVSFSVSYKLDGKDISPADMAGKSGKATIRFDYKNNTSVNAEISGKQEQLCVPFAMLTGMILDNDVFRNVEITNGRLVNDGNRTVAAGIAFPGLQESLKLDSEIAEIPDYFEITANVTDFRMAMTVTIAANDLFSSLSTGKIESTEGLDSSMTELTTAMDQLIKGSSGLYNGLCELLKKSDELVKGIDKLADGSKTLSDGIKTVDSGASEIQSGANQLNEGLKSLDENSSALNSGAKEVFDSLLAAANAQLQASGLVLPELTAENYGGILDQAIAATGAQPLIDLKAQLDGYNSFYQGLLSYTAGVSQAAGGAETLKGGADSLKAGASQLSTGAGELYNGLKKLQESTPALIEGIKQLRDGSQQLSEGLQTFYDEGIKKLVSLVDVDLAGLTERFQAMTEISREYKVFSGISDNMDGNVKFFFRTDEIE